MYDLPNEMHFFTKFILLRMAIRAENFIGFEELYSEFGSNTFIKKIRANRACDVADFYIKHDKKQKALKLYEFIAKTFPASNRAQKGLNDLLKK